MEIDKVIHEPARLKIMMVLSGAEKVDFNFLMTTLDLTRGNLSRHVEKLEAAEYVNVEKNFKGKVPNTNYKITKQGSQALAQYWEHIDALRRIGQDRNE